MLKIALTLLLFALPCLPALGQTSTIAGDWTGTVLSHGQQVPIHLRLEGTGDRLTAALVNGPESAPATTASFSQNHLLLTYPHFAHTLDATLAPDGTLSGSFGTAKVRYPVSLIRHGSGFGTSAQPPSIDGDWEIAVRSAKGESAWQLRVEQSGLNVKAVVQRIDGDTGSLYGNWGEPGPGASEPSKSLRVSHLTPAGPALYTLTPQPDGTLLVSNLLRADLNPPDQQNLVARRPTAARAAHLPEPTESTRQTTMKDPSAPLQFSAPDLTGHIVANTDPRFDGKVVIVAIGGSWCPNCHDEAPLLESLYRQFHSRGLEIVSLSFEEDESQLKNPERLQAFVARYHLDYPVLLAGTTDQLNEKIPQAENLNCWPTSFILGRDGRVREIHAGFAGPANPPAHEALVHEMTHLVTTLLDEPVPTRTAARAPR